MKNPRLRQQEESPAASWGSTKARVVNLFFSLIDYLFIYAYVVIVYIIGVSAEYILFLYVSWILRPEIEHWELVRTWFGHFQIGLALMTLLGIFVHGVLAIIKQMRRDVNMFWEEDK